MINYIRAFSKTRSNIVFKQLSTVVKESTEISLKQIETPPVKKPSILKRVLNLSNRLGNIFNYL